MEKTEMAEKRKPAKHAFSKKCPKCGKEMILTRRAAPKWNWMGIEITARSWKCTACPYGEPEKS